MRRLLRSLTVTAAAVGALVLTGIPAQADPCDSMTGAGSLSTTANETHSLDRAHFVINAGCKDGSPTWGYFDYTDDGNGLRLSLTGVTAYIWGGNDALDPKTGRPQGTRIICGR